MKIILNSCFAVTMICGFASAAAAVSTETELGRSLYHDENLSINRNQACASCHLSTPATDASSGTSLKAAGFVDPANALSGTATSLGSVPGRIGTINTPTAAYALFSPYFHWDTQEGLYVGGQFWNGRAATLAEQAGQPPLNPVEMAMPSKWAVVTRLKENPDYVAAFLHLYGIDLGAIPGKELAPAEQTPPPGVPAAYQAMTKAIGEFEKTRLFAPFTSKFDFYQAGRIKLSALEARGLELWNDEKSQCSACHPSHPMKVPDGRELPAVFTDFTYDNLGLPYNANLPGNPEPEQGLGARAEIAATDPDGEQIGKHKVMTVRNIEITGPYMHNGVLRTLQEVVHFYNTRDAKSHICADNNDPDFGRDCWPRPEVGQNVNTDELGDLKLTSEDEEAIVAFMKTLTDGYPDWGNDPSVPRGTPSPYANVPLPPAP